MFRGKVGCVVFVAYFEVSSISVIVNFMGINVNGRKIKVVLDFVCFRKDVKCVFIFL